VFLRAGGRFKRTVDEHPEEPAVGRGDHTDEVEWAVADGDFEVVDAGVLDDQKDGVCLVGDDVDVYIVTAGETFDCPSTVFAATLRNCDLTDATEEGIELNGGEEGADISRPTVEACRVGW
jgi:hypothetical protein